MTLRVACPGRTFVATTRAVMALAPNVGRAAQVCALGLWLRMKKQTGRRGGRLYRLTLDVAGKSREFCVREYTDLHVIREILVDGDYALDPAFQPRRILDAGSNIGISVIYFRTKYPDATVHAIEADRAALQVLRRNVGSDPHVFVHELAMGGADGVREFVEFDETWKSSLAVPAAPERGGRLVKVRSLASLLDEADWDALDLIKIDIEGGEWEVFEDADLSVCQGWIVGELHHVDARSNESLTTAFKHFDLEIRADGVFRARRIPPGATHASDVPGALPSTSWDRSVG